jgi:hypothetical protein
MSTALVKLALLFQYLRVYKEGPLRTTSVIVAAITALWGVAFSFVAWFPCFPIQGYWNLGAGAVCYGFGDERVTTFYTMYSLSSATNMILDIVILAIPIPLYFRKDTTEQTKLGLFGLLLMGVL